METINNQGNSPKNVPRNILNHYDDAGTSPHRYSNENGKKLKKEMLNRNNIKSKAMSNKKVILGVAAGVAALAVTAVILKRKGYLDGLGEKAEEFGHKIKDKYRTAKENASKKLDEMIQKGEAITEKAEAEIKSATA